MKYLIKRNGKAGYEPISIGEVNGGLYVIVMTEVHVDNSVTVYLREPTSRDI